MRFFYLFIFEFVCALSAAVLSKDIRWYPAEGCGAAVRILESPLWSLLHVFRGLALVKRGWPVCVAIIFQRLGCTWQRASRQASRKRVFGYVRASKPINATRN